METKNKAHFVKDLPGKKLTVTRHFDAPVEQVWRAWTEKELLEQWWAPKPWRAETKEMDFRTGGHWLYAMVGPEGERHYGMMEYTTIDPVKSFSGKDVFCDEKGTSNKDLPATQWQTTFGPEGEGTKVTVISTFASTADFEKLLEMGFEQGFTLALENLDDLLERTRR